MIESRPNQMTFIFKIGNIPVELTVDGEHFGIKRCAIYW